MKRVRPARILVGEAGVGPVVGPVVAAAATVIPAEAVVVEATVATGSSAPALKLLRAEQKTIDAAKLVLCRPQSFAERVSFRKQFPLAGHRFHGFGVSSGFW